MSQSLPILLPLLALGLLIGLKLLADRFPKSSGNVFKRRLLTPAEESFYRVALLALPESKCLMAKVHLADLVGTKDRSTLNQIIQKHVDFVVCDAATLDVDCVLELDDRSHQAPRRRQRDRLVDDLLGRAGIPIVRVRCAESYSVKAIREQMSRATDAKEVAQGMSIEETFRHPTRGQDGRS